MSHRYKSPGPPRAQQLLLLLVAILMGYHAYLHDQYEELLEVDGVVTVDIQLSEPSVSILFLSRWRKKDLRDRQRLAVDRAAS